MKIKPVTRLRNNQAVSLYTEVEDHFVDFGPVEHVTYLKYKSAFEECGNALVTAYNKNKQLSKTSSIDHQCDVTFVAIGDVLKGYTQLDDTTMSVPAMKLWSEWKKFGYKTTRLDLDNEIVDYSKFIRILESSEFADDLAVFPIVVNMVGKLGACVSDLREQKEAVQNQIANNVADDNASEAKEKFIRFFNENFWKFLEFFEMDEPEVFKPLCVAIQGSINRINQIVTLRETLADNENNDADLAE